MNRMTKALAIVFALMALFFGLMNRFEHDRSTQAVISVCYMLAVVAVLRWARRRPPAQRIR